MMFNPWRHIDSAPMDRDIEVYAIDPVCPHHGLQKYHSVELLPDFTAITRYHEDAGFCVCTLRVPILWRELNV
jgi:nitrite reductase/ring-hydroxylating ferredoxin subunit